MNSGADYAYNENGNLTVDNNKKITSITYNDLQLPELITFDGNRSIRYVYDASGQKLQKIITDNSVTPAVVETYRYFDDFIYKNDELQSYDFGDGRVRWTTAPAAGGMGGVFTYDYYIRDHLNDIRVILTEETETVAYPASSMEDVADKNNLNDPNNYIPYVLAILKHDALVLFVSSSYIFLIVPIYTICFSVRTYPFVCSTSSLRRNVESVISLRLRKLSAFIICDISFICL